MNLSKFKKICNILQLLAGLVVHEEIDILIVNEYEYEYERLVSCMDSIWTLTRRCGSCSKGVRGRIQKNARRIFLRFLKFAVLNSI